MYMQDLQEKATSLNWEVRLLVSRDIVSNKVINVKNLWKMQTHRTRTEDSIAIIMSRCM